ncbi:MAG: hypothetical protein KAI72_07135 [Candidatus Pacebacteria bacterium]|nr:hypothetical protein [Candidatus Paceibacterota bacterium]
MEEQNYNSLESEAGKELIKDFTSFIRFCLRTKSFWFSIILGGIIVFLGALLASSTYSGPDAMMAGILRFFLMIFTVTTGSLVAIIGTWWGVRKKVGTIFFIQFFFITTTVIIFYLGLLLNFDFLVIDFEMFIVVGGISLVLVLILLRLIYVLEIFKETPQETKKQDK